MLLEEDLVPCPNLRRVFCGGEPLSADLYARFRGQVSIPLINLYGPTEATIDSTSYVSSEDHSRGWMPIGRPIANTEIYILDAQRNPVPIGVAGEIYIGGVGLARGYLNQPELTAEKFIHHSFEGKPVRRLYRTGDLARYLADGNIGFLGRIDNQVKIRGYRIELGEVECVLGQHVAVREAVVLVREDNPGDKRLVAYVVPTREPVPTIRELRSFLKEKLPDYMVPAAFVFLDALPLTPNGKLDRKGLPEPVEPQSAEAFAAPRTQAEELLASIWADVLKIDKLGVHDNFFELGGHSLLAARLISRIRDTFRLELPLRGLFEAPTVAGLAEQIGSARAGEARIRDLPIVAEPIQEEYPLSFSQERFWFLSQLDPNNLAYKVTHGFRLSGPLNIDALEKTLSEIMRRHETLRTTFHLSDDKPVQRISDLWSIQLSIIDLTQNPHVDLDSEVQGLFENEHRRPFDLSTDVLLRATLVRLSTDENVLLLGIHHVAWDHWSIGLFLRELSTLYRAFAKAEPSPLTELPIQYKHYALWQRRMFKAWHLKVI